MTVQEQRHEELRRLVEEQTALRRVATLVAAGTSEVDLVAAVTYEIARLVGAQRASTVRWDGDTIRVIGEWSEAADVPRLLGRVFTFGGDTLVARIVTSGAPARVDSPDDYRTELARARWVELGLEASIGAPIVVDGRVWGVVAASRTTPCDPFPAEEEQRLGDFAALVAQAIANAESRREVAALFDEQAALRRVATLVAEGRPQLEVVAAASQEAGRVLGAQAVQLVRCEGVDNELVVAGGWSDGPDSGLPMGSRYHPAPGSATSSAVETGHPIRSGEPSQELGERFAVSAPVIVSGTLQGALTALRPSDEAFPAGDDVRLRSFAELVSQAMANEQAREEVRAARARIVRAADGARERLERNLHDGAQQRLVAVSISLRMATARLPPAAEEARTLLGAASEELARALDDLQELARGIHPAVLTDRGLGPALELLARRAPFGVEVVNELEERLPPAVEAAAYFVVAESLTNIAKFAGASTVEVRLSKRNGVARVEVVDDGVGGADAALGSGLRGVADRVEALDGHLHIVSPPDAGTRVWAEIPLV